MNPILKEFPHQFETDRLLIRMPKQGDGKALYEAVQASTKELKPWMPFDQINQTEEETEIKIRKSIVKFLKREGLKLLAYHKDTGDFICSTGLHNINWDIPKFEIGFWVDSRFSGMGYVTEAVEGITNFAFNQLGARRVEIRCDALNKKSRAVPERLNFQLEGVLQHDTLSVDESELRDTCIYAKVK